MNEPKTPKDPPPEGASPAHNPTGETPHGIPDGAGDDEATGTPSSDRLQSETATQQSGQG